MSTIEAKSLVNSLYRGAVVAGLAIGYAHLGKAVLKKPTPKLDMTAYDAGMASIAIALGVATKDILVKRELLPPDIWK